MRLIIFAAALLLTLLPAPAIASNIWQVDNAEFNMSQSPTPPLNAGEWQSVTLPDRWANGNRWNRGLSGWYRIPLQSKPPQAPTAIYLQRFSINAVVFINNTFVGSGGSFEEPAARNMHRPLLYLLPASAWHTDGPNYVYVRLRVYPDYAHLVAVQIGNHAELKTAYERQYFVQVTLSQVLFTVAFLTALFGLLFWLLVERKALNLLFGLTALSWSIYCLNLFVRDIPFSAKTWWWMIHSNLEWAAVFLMLFARRLTNRRWNWVDYTLIVYATMAAAIYATLEYGQINFVSRRIHLVSVTAVFCMNAWLLWAYARYKNHDALVLGVSLIGVVGLGINDLVRHSIPVDSTQWQTPFYLLQFGAPVMFIILTSYLISRYSRAQQEKAFAVQREQQARNEERDRIYQDLHDDVGAKLLSLVYRTDNAEEADIAREALADIRNIVSQRPNERAMLIDTVLPLLAECEDRCAAAKLSHDLSQDLADQITASAELVYHLNKMVRELLSNTVRHSQATHVTLSFELISDQLAIHYADDGVGLQEGATPGRGLAGIRRRVLELGGQCKLPVGASGFQCAIQLPLQ